MWPKQAVKVQKGRILLPMGRGRPSLILPLKTEGIQPGACTLVWKNGYELHLVYEQEDVPKVESDVKATVDLGQIHIATVVTSNGKSIVISGREIRAQKRLINKAVTKTSKKLHRCNKRSRKWKKTQRAKRKLIDRSKRRIRDLRPKQKEDFKQFLKKTPVLNTPKIRLDRNSPIRR